MILPNPTSYRNMLPQFNILCWLCPNLLKPSTSTLLFDRTKDVPTTSKHFCFERPCPCKFRNTNLLILWGDWIEGKVDPGPSIILVRALYATPYFGISTNSMCCWISKIRRWLTPRVTLMCRFQSAAAFSSYSSVSTRSLPAWKHELGTLNISLLIILVSVCAAPISSPKHVLHGHPMLKINLQSRFTGEDCTSIVSSSQALS